MELNAVFVEKWLVSHLEQLGAVRFIENMKFQNVNFFTKDIPLIVGFEHMDNFSALGTFCDFLNLLGHVNRLGRIIYFSSYCVYSPKKNPYRESDVMLPQNLVGAHAKVLEDTMLYIARRFEVSLTILRLFNVYGSFQDDLHVVPTILKCVAFGDTLQIGGSHKTRDFVHVNDLIELLRMILESKPSELSIYNVGSGIPVSIHDLIQTAGHITGKSCNPIFDATKVRFEADYDYAVADRSKIDKEMGWKPKTSLQDGLSLTYQWILGRR
jgi:nucleoside-diphosphate-sugar epimerase